MRNHDKKNPGYFLAGLAAVLLFLFVLVTVRTRAAGNGTFSVTSLDVGQGDAELISCEGHYMLIDGGMPDQSQKLYRAVKDRGITHLDYLVCTHPHADHAGGLPGALEYASCDRALSPVADYGNDVFHTFAEEMDRHHIPISVPSAGDHFSLGSAVFTVLGPTDTEASMNPNDLSLVLRADYGKNSFLFTGDAEQEEQQLMLWNEYDLLNADVLKAAHHGSANGASAAFLSAVSPKLTVISCGAGNDYGHPHQQTLELLKACGSEVFRTDLQGDITITGDGQSLREEVSRNQDADVWLPGSETLRESSSAAETGAGGSSTYILNKRTGKFHYPGCQSVQEMQQKNKEEYTGDRQTLLDQGYTPCGVCKP
jgi:competence protein ComEC